jgi:ABC-type uncharacterized transport system auxiliary subunit
LNPAKLCLPAVFLLLLAGCISRSLPEVSYYLLEYSRESEKAGLRQEQPLAGAVHISDTELPRAFVRRQIVNRLEGPEYRYLRTHLWGDYLSELIPRLIEKRIRAYGIFGQTSRNYSRRNEGYEIRSRLDRIEFVRWGITSDALIEMELELVDRGSETVMVRHTVRTSAPVPGREVADFAAEANVLILTDIDTFLRQVIKALGAKK